MVDSLTAGALCLSILLQFTAAYLAFKLVGATKSKGWLILSLAFVSIGLERLSALLTLYRVGGGASIGMGAVPVFLISVLITAGMLYISGYFKNRVEVSGPAASEERYRTLVETMNESVVTLDRDGWITYANSKAAELLGAEVEEIVGTHIENYCGEECSRQFMRGIRNPQNVPIMIETGLFDVNGNKKDVLVSISPILDRKGDVTGTIATFSDITMLKKTEEKLMDYAEKLRQNSELKDLFIDILHHDLLNYASIIKGYTELAKNDEISPEVIKIINKNAERIIEVIENATKFSKLASTDKIKRDKMNLADVIKDVIDELRPALSEAGMKVENRIDAELPVRANPVVNEIFWNFLNNAIKYAKDGGKVVVYVEDEGDCWKVNFADFGPGIPDELKAVIFDRFSRASKSGVKGSGLGLAIAKRVAELHSGEVGVADNPQGGSIFWVKLPKGG
jgi:PAS domain S-box-containing protein